MHEINSEPLRAGFKALTSDLRADNEAGESYHSVSVRHLMLMAEQLQTQIPGKPLEAKALNEDPLLQNQDH